MEKDAQVDQQSQQIQRLEQQVEQLSQEDSDDKGAAKLLRQMVERGELELSSDGTVTIVRNHMDVQSSFEE